MDGTPRELTFDCRADRPDEVARIAAKGGFVSNKRVNGQLAVSRALGDQDYKRNLPLVSSEPDMTEHTIHEGDEFFILACDGLWDFVSSEQAVQFVRQRLKPHVPVASMISGGRGAAGLGTDDLTACPILRPPQPDGALSVAAHHHPRREAPLMSGVPATL